MTSPKPPDETVQVRKWDFIWRILIFGVLELTFLVLATVCLTKPIPLLPSSTSSPRLTEAKAITTAIAVAWHTIALFPIKSIVSTAFSAECIAQYRRTGRLQPNVTDRVSCITSGLLAEVSYFLTLRPTLEYRLSFLLVLLVMALVPLGPSVINLNPLWIIHHEDLRIANLTMTKGLSFVPQQQCLAKADEIINLELVGGGIYGYGTQMNRTLIPWPGPGFEANQSIIQYESDAVVYDYNCWWPKFMFNASQVLISEVPDVSWTLWDGTPGRTGYDEDIILPLLNSQDNPLPLSAFIFVYQALDPSDRQAGMVTTWVHITDDDMTGNNTAVYLQPGLTAAVLLCDPQYAIQRAEVTLQDGQINATLAERSPLIGNFPESAANSLFSQALLKAAVPGTSSTVGSPAMASALAMDPGGNQTLLPLPEVNKNMNEIIQSAAKAYISGYAGFDGSKLGVFPSFTSFNQTVAIQHQQPSLISSRPFLVALWVLDCVVLLILVILLCTTSVKEMRLFNLQTMETVYRDLPTGDDGLSPPQQKPDLNTNKLGFTWRAVTFVVLESSFLGLAGYCSTHAIPVYLPSAISSSQAKSATTALVVAWRTLAVFPIKDIISSVFSAECVAQYRRTGRLEPNKSDRVSHATSGLMDQISHFLAHHPTLEYRFAFLLTALVAVIGPLGPGVVILADSPMTRLQDLRVANMSVNGVSDGSQLLLSQRAKTFVGLELLEDMVYGYDTAAEGILIPWPEPGFEQSQNATTYESDIVVYNYSCHWTDAEVTKSLPNSHLPDVPGVSLNGTNWATWGATGVGSLPDQEAILPLVFITSLPHRPFKFAVLFSGNSTFLDLGSTGTSFPAITPKGPSGAALSFSVLLCDPQYKLQRANVTLSNGKLSANVLPALSLIGNFPEAAVGALFSQGLADALGPEEEDPDRLMSPISMLVFTGEFNGTGPLRPFPLPVINDNMNRVLKSAAKAYLSGFNSSSTRPGLPSYVFWNQTATVQYQQLALVASRPFFIGLLALVATTVIVLMVLFKVVDIGKVQLFNLQTLEKVYTDERFAEDN